MQKSESIKVISRGSKLALAQVHEVFSGFPDLAYDLICVQSYGDKNKQISLFNNVPGDFFTRELDQALLNDEADIAIHSAKDLPYHLPKGLTLLALTEASDKTDSLVSKDNSKLNELPSGSVIGTSSISRKKQIQSLRPDLLVVSIRGTIDERLALIGKSVDAIIIATCALKRLGLDGRIAEVLPFDTHPLQGHLAIITKTENAQKFSYFDVINIRKGFGVVSIIGFGPGDPELLTLKAYNKLESADIIYYDYLITPEYLDRFKAEKICVGKRKGNHTKTQEEINELLYQSAIQGKTVVRLKGGDPMIFAHVGEEVEYLKSRHIKTEIVPGITSASAAAAEFFIPLTYRKFVSSVTYLSGHSFEYSDIPSSGTVVLYMASGTVRRIASCMIDKGWSDQTPAALIYNATQADQEEWILSLKEISESTTQYKTPLLIIVGEVVRLQNIKAEELIKPLILVTSTEKEAYREFGKIIHQPLIKIQPIKKIIRVRHRLNKYDWIIFTSKYTVQYFMEWLIKTKRDVRDLSSCKIASVGKRTSEALIKHGINPDLQATDETSHGLIDVLKKSLKKSSHLLLPRSDKALSILPEALKKEGHKVETVVFYRTLINTEVGPVHLSNIDFVALSSPSGVDAFLRIYKDYPSDLCFVARGKTTLEYMKKRKFNLERITTYNELKKNYDKTSAI